MKPERVGIYARVSTLDKGQDVELQLSDLRAYATARGWAIKEYVDIGKNGSKETRPSFDRMMDDVRKRKIDIILVWRLDKFGRSLKHLILHLDEIKTIGVGFVSFKESLDFTTPTGRLMTHLLAAFAEFEKELNVPNRTDGAGKAEKTWGASLRIKNKGGVYDGSVCWMGEPASSRGFNLRQIFAFSSSRKGKQR